MNDRFRTTPQATLVPDPNARKEALDDELEDGKPGADENAAGYLKTASDTPPQE